MYPRLVLDYLHYSIAVWPMQHPDFEIQSGRKYVNFLLCSLGSIAEGSQF